jgi:regulatory protein
VTITDLQPQKRRPGRTSVYVDGEFTFGMDNADLVKYKLETGMEITKERLDSLLRQVVVIKARDTAVRYLAYRPRSRREVEKRLAEDGYPAAVVNYVLRLLQKYGYVNDPQFAKDYAESRLRQGYGAYRVKRELRQKGISDAVMEGLFAVPNEEEARHIREWLARKRFVPAQLSPEGRKRAVQALLRRGYAYQVIRDILNEQD